MRQEIRLLKVYSKKESWKHPFLVHDYVNTLDHFFPFQMNFTLFETFNNDICLSLMQNVSRLLV